MADFTDEFGMAPSSDSDDEMSELGRDPARWFIDNNPHAATATGAVHLDDPDNDFYNTGHGRLEAAYVHKQSPVACDLLLVCF